MSQFDYTFDVSFARTPPVSVVVTPDVLQVSATLNTVDVLAKINVVVQPLVLSSSFALHSPIVSNATSVTVQPAVLASAFTLNPVTVFSVSSVVVQPNVLQATFALNAASAVGRISALAQPQVLASTFNLNPVTVSTVRNSIAKPAVLATSFALNTVVVSAIRKQVVQPSVLFSSFALNEATVSAKVNVVVQPTVLTTSFSLKSVGVNTASNITVQPSVLSLVADFKTVSVLPVRNISVKPSVLSVSYSLYPVNISIVQNALAKPSTLSTAFSLSSANVVSTANALVLATTLQGSFTLKLATVVNYYRRIYEFVNAKSDAYGLGGVPILEENLLLIKDVHTKKAWVDKTNLFGAQVISNLVLDPFGHPIDWTIRNLTPTDIGAQPAGSYALSTHSHSWSDITSGKPTTLSGYGITDAQPFISLGTASQYWRGDKTWQTLNTSVVPESVNLYFTTARVLGTALAGYAVGTNAALTAADTVLSAFGKLEAQINAKQASGSYSLTSHTHAFSEITAKPTTLVGYGITDAVPSSRTITINGTTFDLSANRSWSIPVATGTVTSVGISGGTTGLAASAAITTSGTITLSGTLVIANGGTGQTTAQGAINALAGAVTSGQFLRGNGTNVVMSGIQASDVPTLNQNTTGSAGTLTTARTLTIGSTGKIFNGSANVTWSLAEIGAQAAGSYGLSNADITAASLSTTTLTLTRAAGNITAGVPTWNQNTTGNAASANVAFSVASGEIADLNTAWTLPGTSLANDFRVYRYSTTATNKPVTFDNANWLINIYSHQIGVTASYGHQLAGADNGTIYFRNVQDGAFGTWFQFWHTGNLATPVQGYSAGAQAVPRSIWVGSSANAPAIGSRNSDTIYFLTT